MVFNTGICITYICHPLGSSHKHFCPYRLYIYTCAGGPPHFLEGLTRPQIWKSTYIQGLPKILIKLAILYEKSPRNIDHPLPKSRLTYIALGRRKCHAHVCKIISAGTKLNHIKTETNTKKILQIANSLIRRCCKLRKKLLDLKV